MKILCVEEIAPVNEELRSLLPMSSRYKLRLGFSGYGIVNPSPLMIPHVKIPLPLFTELADDGSNLIAGVCTLNK